MMRLQILAQVISELNSTRGKYCQIKHKRGWLEYLDHGQWAFTPQELHQTLYKVIDSDGGRPRGEKLFHLQKRYSFTISVDKRPYRPEEALERFIVVSNDDNFFGQIPIGGGKESIDIGIQRQDSKFIFIELKPWRSANNPLYALVESLQNLVEYRLIIKHGIQKIPNYNTVDLMVLAPVDYYQEYGLLKSKDVYKVEKLVADLGRQFQTSISFMALSIDEQVFLNRCKQIYDQRGNKGQQKVVISEADAMSQLKVENWRTIISMDG